MGQHWGLALLTACTCGGSMTARVETHNELLLNVEAIRTSELALRVVDDYRACSDADAARASATAEPRPWDGDKCWVKIGWEPDEPVRGGYWVELTDDGFEVHGVADADGDGVWAEVVATDEKWAERITPDDVY